MSTLIFSARLCAGLLLAAIVTMTQAQSTLPPERLPLQSFEGFLPVGSNWIVAGGITGDPRREKIITAQPGTGLLVGNPVKGAKTNLTTVWTHGDMEVDLEFLLTPGSNSGVYLQGRYEVQLFDSWGVRALKAGDSGGIYQRWDPARGPGNEGYEGHAPRVNAARAPGLWQQLRIVFRAPRFSADGRKLVPARMVEVKLNGFLIHENVELQGPTRSGLFSDEAPLGPLMIQGDHGPVALRNLMVKRLDSTQRIEVEALRYQLYSGDFKVAGNYQGQSPVREGSAAQLTLEATEPDGKKNGKFGVVFQGEFVTPREGDYVFSTEASGSVRLLVDEQAVIQPLEKGGQPGRIKLTAGRHAFRLDFVHSTTARAALELTAEGPGLHAQRLTKESRQVRSAPKSIPVNPQDRILVQRGFVPFEPKKRLYAASVGTPAGVHYAYDFETGSLLRAWRGDFVDTVEMWEGRGSHQQAKPLGPSLTFHAKPTVVLMEFPQTANWPDQPDALASSQGYILEPDGQPLFLSTLSTLSIRDRLAPAPEGLGLKRRIELSGALAAWETWVLLAEADRIEPQSGGQGWLVGDREYFIDWPPDSGHKPILRRRGGRDQLVVRITKPTLEAPLNYTLVW